MLGVVVSRERIEPSVCKIMLPAGVPTVPCFGKLGEGCCGGWSFCGDGWVLACLNSAVQVLSSSMFDMVHVALLQDEQSPSHLSNS